MQNKITVHMIGNAHIDPVWLWKWQEGYAETLATCRSALDRMNETPDFVFTRADAATYLWIEESDPEMFEEIRRRVAEGRWSLVGGWWEQPDCNIPSGESFARHALYGKHYFLEKFGVDVKVGYNVDSFGHNSGLPQLLKESGIDYYVFFRPGPHEKDLPGMLFYWQGPDGSRVLACRPMGHYCSGAGELDAEVRANVEARSPGSAHAVCFYGVGNHGGGPTKANIASIQSMNRRIPEVHPVFDSLDGFFEAVISETTDYPVVDDDLQHHAVGCYSAHSGIKKLNRRTENLLVTAEKFSTAANLLTGRPYPRDLFSEAWKTLLFNQFHDILAGTSLPEDYEDVRDEVGGASAAASHELNGALQAITQKIDTSRGGRPFVVFNPHAWPVTVPVMYDDNRPGLTDDEARAVPTQPVCPVLEDTSHRRRNVFLAELPAFGYRVYYSSEQTEEFDSGELSVSIGALENSFWRIQVDRKTGWIASIFDKWRSVEILSSPAAPVVLDDQSDTWSHGVVNYRDEVGRFSDARLSVAESGPVRVVLRVESRYGDSSFRQEIALYRDRRLIECRCMVDWHQKHKVLKLAFPFAVEAPLSTYDSAYSATVRPTDGAENPGQMWVDVSGKLVGDDYGVALINDCKYGFDVLESELRMTVLRSPIYAFHEPRQVEVGKQYRYMDQGEQEFVLGILPHEGDWDESDVVREASVLNALPAVVESHQHSGQRPGCGSWMELPRSVVLGALKLAEDDDFPVMRLYESAGARTDSTVSCFGTQLALSLDPFELKTVKLTPQGAVETDVLERP